MCIARATLLPTFVNFKKLAARASLIMLMMGCHYHHKAGLLLLAGCATMATAVRGFGPTGQASIRVGSWNVLYKALDGMPVTVTLLVCGAPVASCLGSLRYVVLQ